MYRWGFGNHHNCAPVRQLVSDTRRMAAVTSAASWSPGPGALTGALHVHVTAHKHALRGHTMACTCLGCTCITILRGDSI